MTIEKLPSGSYRATVMQDGKRYRRTFDHKPTQKEVLMALSEELNSDKKTGFTFRKASERYVDSKSNVISANTYREYSKICDRLPKWFVDFKIDDMEQVHINRVVNELSKDKSPKTVRNYHAFITAVLGLYRPKLRISTTLPQKRKIEPYIPSENDIKTILDDVKGTKFFIPLVLACNGMRRGEICALTPSDIKGNAVYINKAMAYTKDKKWVVKAPKTTDSERCIFIPQEIADTIRQQGYVYDGHPNSITCKLRKIQDKHGMEHFSIHKLRHYFASKMLTITDMQTVQSMGGWKTNGTLMRVYAHSLAEEQEKARRQAIKILNDGLF